MELWIGIQCISIFRIYLQPCLGGRCYSWKSGTSSHLIGTRIGDVDDSCSQLRLQVVNEGGFKSLSLINDVVLISSARQREEKAELTLALRRQKETSTTPDTHAPPPSRSASAARTVILLATLSS